MDGNDGACVHNFFFDYLDFSPPTTQEGMCACTIEMQQAERKLSIDWVIKIEFILKDNEVSINLNGRQREQRINATSFVIIRI